MLILTFFHLDFPHAFLYSFVMRFYTLLSCVLYITKMRFRHQLMRFHKTAYTAAYTAITTALYTCHMMMFTTSAHV